MHSCIYEGRVRHRRFSPVDHRFQYRLFMVYLDLCEAPELMRRKVLSPAWFAPASFRQGDHFADADKPLDQQVRLLLHERTGLCQRGPIRLLTQLRYFGYYFSPLNLFFCFDQAGKQVEAVVAEVQNTPWRERYCYVLWDGNRVSNSNRFEHDKAFHVSPFLSMDMSYRWNLTDPGDQLRVSIDNFGENERLFHADMILQRRALSRTQLLRTLVQYPLMTGKITAAIYYQAFRLWRKKCPYYPHPKTIQQSNETVGIMDADSSSRKQETPVGI